MTAPHPRCAWGFRAALLGISFITIVGRATAGAGPACVPPPLLVPTQEPPLADTMVPVPAKPTRNVAEPADPPTPVVVLRVRVLANAAAGQELEYRICVENCSPAAAHHVLIRNPLPANARFVRASPEPAVRDPELLWRLGTLEGGAKQQIVLILAPTGGGEVKNCARVQFEYGECVTTQVTRPSLSLQKQGPTQAVLSETLNYRLTLTNSGGTELTNVLLTDILPDGLEHASGKDRLSWIVGTLAPGQSRSVDYQVVAKRLGRLCNKAVATATGGLKEEKESCVTVGERKIALAMTGPERRYLNISAAYQITVRNSGTISLTNVVINNPIPAETTFQSATSGGEPSGGQVQWRIETLPPTESRTVEIRLRAQMPGRICNQAVAAADGGLTAQAEACTDFTGASALSLDVEDNPDPVEVGSPARYTITVRNPGSNPVTRVQIVATVPEQMTVVQAGGSSDHRKEGQKIVYDPLVLPAGGEARFRIDVTAQRPGDVRFKVELTADQLTAGPVQQEESTTIFAVLPSSRRKPTSAKGQ